jgi:hypothetical protein
MSDDMNKIIEIKKTLQKNAEEIEEWYEDCADKNSYSYGKAIEFIENIDDLCKFCTIKNKKQVFEEVMIMDDKS